MNKLTILFIDCISYDYKCNKILFTSLSEVLLRIVYLVWKNDLGRRNKSTVKNRMRNANKLPTIIPVITSVG